MPFRWSTLRRPIIGLSPMADMTDAPFCRIVRAVSNGGVREHDRIPILWREMISSEAIVRGNAKTLAMARFDEIERPLVQQIFGSDPDTMARSAAMIVEQFAPDGIDINMGCPVYKLTSNFNGAALMQEPKRASAIIRSVKAAINVPVSVKIRLGWNDRTQGREFAKRLEDAGADLLTVHGRTATQRYSEGADWREIGEIKKRVSIPVLANGDITDGLTAARALAQSNADGVMIGRGALGNPWVFREIETTLRHSGESMTSPQSDRSNWGQVRMTTILLHAQLMLDRYGPHGIIQFRKHLIWYFKRVAGTKTLRQRLMAVNTIDELRDILFQSFQH